VPFFVYQERSWIRVKQYAGTRTMKIPSVSGQGIWFGVAGEQLAKILID
jgi:hypothetical protein